MIRIERHRQGPRLFIVGRRIHECHVGIALVAAALLGASVERRLSYWLAAALAAGAYMTIKDARDLFPRWRDTGAWRLGLHRRFAPLRTMRHAEGLPWLAGAVAFAIGVVNLASALTPNIAWRGHLLLQVMPVRAVPLFHTVAIPLSVMLVVTSFYLRRRRQRAWALAFALLTAIGVLDLAKGLDFEEALLSWAGAGLLWIGRDTFTVEHDAMDRRSKLWPLAAGIGSAVAIVASLVWLASDRHAEEGAVVRETIALFFFTHGSMSFRDEFGWVPVAVSGLTIALTVVAGALLFKPRRPPGALPSDETRAEAIRLVEEHGSDTLAFFKLRRDLQYLFSRSRDAFLGYRTENGVLLVAGDPLGPAHAVRELIRDACAFAEAHGLRIAVLGASDRLVPIWRDAGLRTMYLGDEAIVDLRAFSLEGRAIRKVRQSVNRLVAAGYDVDVLEVAELDPAELAELERVSVSCRTNGPERGFAMAMDTLAGGLVVVARDGDGAARGLLHFVPTHGRAAASLALMRADRTSPNGLTEFLVVRAIESLRERGIEELSLNFVAFGRLIERPLARRLLVVGNRWFQLESLHRFSTKFSPRWQPRFFMFDGVLGLPRAGLAALLAEGQIPRLRP